MRIGRILIPELATSPEIGEILCLGIDWFHPLELVGFCAQRLVEFQLLNWLEAGYVSLPLLSGPGFSFIGPFHPTITNYPSKQFLQRKGLICFMSLQISVCDPFRSLSLG